MVQSGPCIVTHHTSLPTTTTTTTSTSTRAGPAATSASSRMERLSAQPPAPPLHTKHHTRPPLPHHSQSFPDLASAKAPPDFHTESDTRSQPALFFCQIPGPCGRASQIEVCGIEQSPRSLSTPVAGAGKDKELTFSRQKAADAARAHSSY